MRSKKEDYYRVKDELENARLNEITTKYYYLQEGEIIQEGDEVEMSNCINDSEKWVPAGVSVGQKAPDPSFPAHRKYRRPIPG